MKAGRFFVTATIIFSMGLAGCGAVKDAKDADNMEKEGTAKLAAVNSETKDLSEKEKIFVSSTVLTSLTASTFEWSKKSPEERQVLRLRLDNLIGNISRIFEIGAHKNMRLKGDTSGLHAVRENAKEYLASLNKFEGKPVEKESEVKPAPADLPDDRKFRG